MSYLYAKLHDGDGEVDVSQLTSHGRDEAVFQCRRLIEEIEAAGESDSEERSRVAETRPPVPPPNPYFGKAP